MIIMALLATMLSVELVLVIGALLSQVPVPVDTAFVKTIIWQYQKGFVPQRNLLFYFIWLGLSSGAYVCLWAAVKYGKDRLKTDLKGLLIVHILVAFLMAHAGFAVLADGNPLWALPFFWGAFISGVLTSIFWPEFLSCINFLKGYFTSLKVRPWVGCSLACLFIFLVIFMPDLKAVVAMLYMGDYFHTWDANLFGAVYAVSKGLIPCMDVDVQYGFGATVMLAKMVNLTGGFEYAKVFAIVMWSAIVYFVLWFLLLRRFLASSLLAFAAVIFAIRMQMFTSDPIIWAAIMSSVFRYCFEVGVFWMLWMHIQTRRMIFLAAGAFIVSLAVFHMSQTGIYSFVVFGLYVCLSAIVPALGGNTNRMAWRNHALAIASVFLWTGLWFYLSVGKNLFEVTFWRNLTYYGSFYIKGFLCRPLADSISESNVISGIGGLLYPIFYMMTFLYAAGKVITARAQKRDVFAGLLAFYGLLLHTYYMVEAVSWYIIGLPGIFLLFYWASKGLEKIPAQVSKRVAWGLAIFSIYCLITTKVFTGYPNLLSVSRNPVVDSRTYFRVGRHVPYFHQLLADYPESLRLPLNSLGEKDEQLKYEDDFKDDEELKSYYSQQTAWPEDTAMIRRLTPEGGRAAVLSSFELLLLKNAGRKPFFYHFPIINSRPLTVRNFMVTCLISYPEIQDILNQLETQKPGYIFMERIFLTPQVPQVYFYEYNDLIILLRYVLSKYKPVEVGKYLVAMKRV